MLNEGKTIELKYNENSFLLSFISVSYQYQQDIQYSYQLEGFEQSWSAPTNELSIRYTNIPPGNYTFHVKSMSKNGGQQLDEQTIRIHIAQPFCSTVIEISPPEGVYFTAFESRLSNILSALSLSIQSETGASGTDNSIRICLLSQRDWKLNTFSCKYDFKSYSAT
jgi:hypothetical protein